MKADGRLSRAARSAKETAILQDKNIVVVVDYHAQNINFRWFNQATEEVRVGKMVWIMESTTGWASEYSLDGTALFMEEYSSAASHSINGSI